MYSYFLDCSKSQDLPLRVENGDHGDADAGETTEALQEGCRCFAGFGADFERVWLSNVKSTITMFNGFRWGIVFLMSLDKQQMMQMESPADTGDSDISNKDK